MRIFSALPLPEEMSAYARDIALSIKKKYPEINPVRSIGFHITLFFFGELDMQEIDSLSRVMDIPEFKRGKIELAFGKIGQFPKRGNPRVLYLDIYEGREEIIRFQKSYVESIASLGYREERNRFVPHITLARNKKGNLKGWDYGSFPLNKHFFQIDRFVLFQSILKGGGVEYIPLKTLMFE